MRSHIPAKRPLRDDALPELSDPKPTHRVLEPVLYLLEKACSFVGSRSHWTRQSNFRDPQRDGFFFVADVHNNDLD